MPSAERRRDCKAASRRPQEIIDPLQARVREKAIDPAGREQINCN
jgi:hypothetical protein